MTDLLALALRNVIKEPFGQSSICPLRAKPGLALNPPKLGEKSAIRFAGSSALDLPMHDPIVALAADRLGAEFVRKEATDSIRCIRTDPGVEYEPHDDSLILPRASSYRSS